MTLYLGMERKEWVTRVGIDGPTGDRRSLLVSAEDGSLQWVARAG